MVLIDRLRGQAMMLAARLALALFALSLSACAFPNEHLSFPDGPLRRDARTWYYDTDGDGKADFALMLGPDGRCESIAYDDDEDGKWDRVYRLDQYDPDTVPHVVLMLDSIPYRTVAERYAKNEWPWFDPPAKVIPPFPSMTGVIFTTAMHAPPMPGMINRHYDRQHGKLDNMIIGRAFGQQEPWHRRTDYDAKYWENGLAFLQPRRWYATEMARAKAAVDASPRRVTFLYIASSAAMLSRYGERGANEVLDAIDPFCVQLLHDRQGAVKISIFADHGHNYLEGRRIDLTESLTAAGFHMTDHLQDNQDVVIDTDGLVNYVGFHTRSPAKVAAVLAAQPQVQFATYMSGEEVIVCDAHGRAAVDRRQDRYRYRALDHDVLGYAPLIERLKKQGLADADGFVSARDWLAATADDRFPDAPFRLWQAYHGLVTNPPDVMLACADGYCGGIGFFELFIHMQSTHGGLDQINSATFLLDMAGKTRPPMRSQDILPTILPGYVPPVR